MSDKRNLQGFFIEIGILRIKDDIFKAFLFERLPLATWLGAPPGASQSSVLLQTMFCVEDLLASGHSAGEFLLLVLFVEPVEKGKLVIVFLNLNQFQIRHDKVWVKALRQ